MIKTILKYFVSTKIFLKNTFHKGNYFKKILISFISTSCITFLIFSLIFVYAINNDYQENLNQVNQKNILQLSNINKTILGDIFSFSLNKFFYNYDLTALMYNKEFKPTDALLSNKIFSDFKTFSSLIHSIHIINFNAGHVLSDSNNKQSIDSFHDQLLIKLLQESIPSNTPIMFIPRAASYIYNSKLQNVNVISLIFHNSYEGAFVINISYDKFIAMENASNILTNTVILNNSGQVLTHSNEELFGTDFSQNAIYKEIVNRPLNNDSFSYVLDNINYSINYLKNDTFGFTYITMFKNQLINPDNNLLLKCISYSIIYILVATILSLILSSLLYRPLGNLRNSLNLADHTPFREEDEFSSLANLYMHIIGENSSLKLSAHQHLKELNLQIIRKLLTSNFISEVDDLELNRLNEIFNRGRYIVLIMSLDQFNQINDYQEDIKIIKYCISNIIDELVSKYYLIQTINFSSYNQVSIINFDDLDKEMIISFVKQIQLFIHSHFKVTVSCGIGTIVSDLEDIISSYDNACIALSYRLVTGNNSINLYECLNFTPQDQQVYPYELESSIISHIKNCKAMELKIVLHEFFNTISSYNFNQIIQYVLQLSSSIQHIEYISHIHVEHINFDIFASNTLEDIEQILFDNCINTINMLSESKSQDPNKIQLIQDIDKLVDQNLYNPNLSVVFLSDKVNLSVNYLRSIYKEQTGESLFSYIINKRLSLICHLLTNTNLSIQDISEKLGFSTKNYFSTFFKKNIGMTPSQYRMLHQTPSLSDHSPIDI